MKWFKHDTDASIDAKLQELLLDYGASGYGLYWYCVELIAQKVDKSNFTFELEHDARIIARNLNLTIQETTDMMKKMISLGLFSMIKNNKLACYALSNRLDQSMTSNKEFRQMIDNYKQSHGSVMINPDKVMQEEKRREEKILDKPFTFTLTRKASIENTSTEYKDKLQAYIESSNKQMTYKDFYDYCVLKDYKYKDFKRAYDSWNKDTKPKKDREWIA